MHDREAGCRAAAHPRACNRRGPRRQRGWPRWAIAAVVAISLSGCSAKPLMPYTADTPPLVLVPAALAGVQDKRGRFREIFCRVLEARGPVLPDYRPCEEALTRVGRERGDTRGQVDLGPSKRRLIAVLVPGIGWDCFADWVRLAYTARTHVRQFGYDLVVLEVDSLSSSSNNARQIREAILQTQADEAEPRLVLIGYSKGAADILEAMVSYPEIRPRVAAVISAAGAVGGSPLANDVEQSHLALFRTWPGARCSAGDGGAIESLRPGARQAWLAQNPLPPGVPFYSLVAFPQPGNISSVLKIGYDRLSRVDARNDGQILFYDQVIPHSSLLGYINADHWAVSVPVARAHRFLGKTFVDRNAYPREALLEALLRFVEEDLAAPEDPS